VIAALHDSKAFADEHLEAAIRGSAVAKEKDEELRASSRVAREKIAKVIPGFAVAGQAAGVRSIFQRVVAGGFGACVYAAGWPGPGSDTARSCFGLDMPSFLRVSASSGPIRVR